MAGVDMLKSALFLRANRVSASIVEYDRSLRVSSFAYHRLRSDEAKSALMKKEVIGGGCRILDEEETGQDTYRGGLSQGWGDSLERSYLRQISAITKAFPMVTISTSTTRHHHHSQISESMFPSIAATVFTIANFLIQVPAYMS